MEMKSNQVFENLPEEILVQPRWFKVCANKRPIEKGWSKPENQKIYSEIGGNKGFDTSGHGKGEDYLFLDFDHVLADSGTFINAEAERFFTSIQNRLKSYCELSASKHGIHIIARPTAGKFGKIASGKNGKIYFNESKSAFLEIFYGTGGRYCYFTGDVFQCEPKNPIACGAPVDTVFSELLDTILAKKKSACAESKKNCPEQCNVADSEFNEWKVEKIISEFINVGELSDTDWLSAITALKSLGYSYEEIDRLNQGGKHYDEKENRERWESVEVWSKDTAMGTLVNLAKRLGYDPQAAYREFCEKQSPESASEKLTRLLKNPQKNFVEIRRIIKDACHWNLDKHGNPTTIKGNSFSNHKLIFENDPNLRGLFGRDDFRQEIVFFRRAVWHSPNAPFKDSWDDNDDAELRMYLRENYVEMSHPQTTFDFIVRTAREHSFHAVRRFLDSLPKWDGVERAENIFVKFLGAENSLYTRAVTKHFLFGAIARALYPGCDFQEVPVLQGAQGIGKSRLVRMLGGKHGVNPSGENWHIALRDQLDDSHAVDAMRKGWVIEIEEFAAGSRADVNAMKGVLSADDVTRRFAYDRRAKTIKSHWVFIATCNDEAPLRDQTGARRFLPIKCHNKESTIVDGMTAEYIRQVWSEVYQKFKAMFPTVDDFDADKLRLTPEIQQQAAERAKEITQDDEVTNEIKGFVDRKIPPLIIWNLLSKEERRKYFVDGGKFTIELADLQARFKNYAGRRFDELKPTFDKACEVKDGFVRQFTDKNDHWILVFYGAELRKTICATEIFNECFGQDNRKRINRIAEILSQLEGWHFVGRLRNVDPIYPDQRKAYQRD